MSTLILEESKGSAVLTAEQQDKIKKENDLKLKEIILTAAEEAKLEATPELIAQAKLRFSFRDGKVRPLSIYREVSDFLEKHNHGAQKIKTVTEMVDERAMKKKRLYEELCHYAEIGDMKSYRIVRAEYAKL